MRDLGRNHTRLHDAPRRRNPVRRSAVGLLGALLALTTLTGEARAATPGTNGRIAFTSTRDAGDTELYTVAADGTGLARLTARFGADDQPSWSPDGTLLAFRSHRDGNTDIYVMRTDGSGVRRVTTDASADSEPTWAPDGQRLAFNRNGDIYVIGLDGAGERQLTTSPFFDGQPAWSPDGQWIAFTSTRTGNGEVFAARADGSVEVNLTNRIGADSDPTWSPDGTRIAYISSQPTSAELTVMPASGLGIGGSGATVLTSDSFGDLAPSWSPDGTRIAFESNRDDANPEIYTIALTGGAIARVTAHPAHDILPDWGAAAAPITVIDASAPVTSVALGPASPDGQGGWYTRAVHATVSASDEQGGSGVAATRCSLDPSTPPASFADLPSGCAYLGAGADVGGDGEHVLYAASRDNDGNTQIPVKQAFKIDRTAPTVSCARALSLKLGLTDATVIATVGDAASGPAQSQVSAAADTTSVGAKTVTLTGTDLAGHQTTSTCGYTVSYAFGGFAQPVDNLDANGHPVLNVVKAGRAIPLKWRLTDATGAPITTLTSAQITVVGISCSQDTTLDQLEETAAGASGLQNLGDGNYQLNWKSPTSYAGSCKRLRLDLAEGSYHTADFKFTN